MPEDVVLGAGYVGDALFTRFPGQYRDPEMDSAQRAHFNAFPGNHGPAYTDPDSGRKLALKELPGIGQVVVPVEHTMAAVYPADHTMVGLEDLGDEDPASDLGRLKWHNTLVLALDQSANMTNSAAQLGTAFSNLAQAAVKRALDLAAAGRFKTAEKAVQYIKHAIIAAASHFNPSVRHMAEKVAASTVATAGPAIKKAWTAKKPGKRAVRMGHGKHRPAASGAADWPGSMMGVSGIQESIANLTAGSELDQLNRSISKLNDALVSAYDQVTALKAQETAAQANAPQAPSAADEQYVQYLSAVKSVTQGYKSLTGFDYMTQVIANVMTPSAAKLDSVYGGITGLLGQIKNWNDTWQSQIGNSHPEMVQLWDQIQNEHNRLWAQAKKGPFDLNDPSYLTTAQQAVERLTGVSADAAGLSGMGDFGVTALIGVIVVAIAAVAITVAVVKLAGQFNVVAHNLAKQRADYEAAKEVERQQYIDKRTSEGATVEEATQEWVALKAQYDAAEAKKEQDYAKSAPSAGDLGKYIGYAAAGIGAVIALPHIMRLLGL